MELKTNSLPEMGYENNLTLPEHVDFHTVPYPPRFNIHDTASDGRYQLTDILCSNSHGAVYRAVDWGGETDVALKVFREPDKLTRDRVDLEFLSHIALNGIAGIIRLRDTGVLEEGAAPQRYLATELADGTFQDHVNGGRDKQAVDMIKGMSAQILPALGQIHAAGLVHRDIKPENILGTRYDGGWKWDLADFGIVGIAGEIKLPEMATSVRNMNGEWGTEAKGSVVGTLGYIAPERIEAGTISPKADVFAMGVTIFNAATGELPFCADSFQEYRTAVTHESPASIHNINRSVPAKLDKLTRDCLRPDPEDRPTVPELARDMEYV